MPGTRNEQPPARSPSRFLVLALVGERPEHGYAVGRRYEQRFGGLVPMGAHGVYRILDSLEQDGLVQGTRLQSDPMARRVGAPHVCYRITDAGECERRDWLLTPVRRARWRAELLARLDTGGVLDAGGLLELLNRYEQENNAEGRGLERRLAGLGGLSSGRTELLQRLVVEEQLQRSAAGSEWAWQARVELQEYGRTKDDGASA
jgi:DNA-binding PadR family transcriptional regulator